MLAWITDTVLYNYIIIPGALVLGGLVVGMIVERIVVGRLSGLARSSDLEGVGIVTDSLRGLVTVWFLLAGVYTALQRVDVPPRVERITESSLLILVILAVTLALARILGGFVLLFAKRSDGLLPATTLFSNLGKLVVFILGALVILQYLGIPITPVLTALGVGGIAIALALQDTLANLFAGLHIIASRQIRPGDYVKLDSGDEGFVQDITWRYTVIRALPNNLIVVPNSKISSAIFTNYNLPQSEMSVVMQVGVSYDSDLSKVERVTIEVAKDVQQEVEGAVPDFEPFIRYHTFGESSINFSVILRAREFVAQHPIRHAFVLKLQARYHEEGIVIPFPIRTVHLREKTEPQRH